MAKLTYKLEFNRDDGAPADASVYIQLRVNPPIYQKLIDKEDYDILPPELKHEFTTNLFNISGVTELSIRAYRVWLMKSPIYSWEEVLLPVLFYMANWYGFDGIEAYLGSGSPDGSGLFLPSTSNRRKL